ncbi:MAG: hypothetical protein QM775_12115 [Pirellulales bacterium]
MKSLMRVVGKSLQVVALVALPLAIPLELQGVIRTGPMLTIMVGSIALFYVGRIVEGYGNNNAG